METVRQFITIFPDSLEVSALSTQFMENFAAPVTGFG